MVRDFLLAILHVSISMGTLESDSLHQVEPNGLEFISLVYAIQQVLLTKRLVIGTILGMEIDNLNSY